MVVAAVAAAAAVVGAVVAVAVSSEIGELLQLGAPASPRRTHSSSAAWQLQGGDALGRKFAPFEGHGRIQPTKLSSPNTNNRDIHSMLSSITVFTSYARDGRLNFILAVEKWHA